MKLLVVCTALLIGSSSFAAQKPYQFPGGHETLTDAAGNPVQGAIVHFALRLHAHKFSGAALFPPADLALCGMGKAIGGAIGGFLGGPHQPEKSCWDYWQEDTGLKPVDSTAGDMTWVSDASGAVHDPAQNAYLEMNTHSYVPTLAVTTEGFLVPFEYSSSYTPATTLLCQKKLAQPACATMVAGKDNIQKAAAKGLVCTLPYSADELARLRAQATESCTAYLKAYEERYHASFLGQFQATTWVPADYTNF